MMVRIDLGAVQGVFEVEILSIFQQPDRGVNLCLHLDLHVQQLTLLLVLV